MDVINSLLSDFVGRKKIGRQMQASSVITACNQYLKKEFGDDILDEAGAISYKKGHLRIGCRRNIVAQEVIMRKAGIKQYVESRVPDANIDQISTRSYQPKDL